MEEDYEKKLKTISIKNRPTIFLVVGMAGSGKTTFCQRLYSWISQKKCNIDKKSGLNSFIYSINLDPAVINTKMPLNLDIKDHIDYYDVMEKHNLGSNGAITTSLNLFLLKINELFDYKDSDYIIIDTPGQIESFTWSSPGFVLRDFFKNIGNLVMVYLVDSVASQDPSVFMSNMMYAISLQCRYDLSVLCTFNKTDLQNSDKIEKWIRDYEQFRRDLDVNKNNSSLLGSLSLHFEELYNEIDTIAVSSKIGSGREDFFNVVDRMINQL